MDPAAKRTRILGCFFADVVVSRFVSAADATVAKCTVVVIAPRSPQRLRRDFDAVKAALKLPWTTSPVEGQNSRLKMLKRTMYGRAGIELLRARVLHAA